LLEVRATRATPPGGCTLRASGKTAWIHRLEAACWFARALLANVPS
jgi:hypothetical protein